MKTLIRYGLIFRYGLTFCMLAIVSPMAVPAASAQKLSPPSHQAFVLFEFDVKNKDAFKGLAAKVRESVKSFNGEFVMREKVDSLFGGTPSNLSVISFPTIDAAKRWLASPEYNKFKQDRAKTVDVRSYLVEKIE